MPTYVYLCEKCKLEFEFKQSIKEDPAGVCPQCESVSDHRIPCMITIINKTPSTIGGLADKRRSEMGSYNYQDTIQKMANERKQLATFKGAVPEGAEVKKKEDFKRPPWRPDRDTPDHKLANMTPEQTVKYCFEGKRPIGV